MTQYNFQWSPKSTCTLAWNDPNCWLGGSVPQGDAISNNNNVLISIETDTVISFDESFGMVISSVEMNNLTIEQSGTSPVTLTIILTSYENYPNPFFFNINGSLAGNVDLFLVNKPSNFTSFQIYDAKNYKGTLTVTDSALTIPCNMQPCSPNFSQTNLILDGSMLSIDPISGTMAVNFLSLTMNSSSTIILTKSSLTLDSPLNPQPNLSTFCQCPFYGPNCIINQNHTEISCDNMEL